MPGEKFQRKRIIWYSINMEENLNLQRNLKAQQTAEKSVNDFLDRYHFTRTFPLNFVTLADKIGGFRIYYLSDKNDFFNKAVGAFSPIAKRFAIHPRFNIDRWHFLMGRYILAKLFAHYALRNIELGKIWVEMDNSYRPKEDLACNEETANFAFELLMPAVEFKHQWKLLGKDVKKIAQYFEVPEFKVTERILFLGLNNDQQN